MLTTSELLPRARDLPEQWLAAYDEDRRRPLLGNDPVPERRAGRLLAAFIVTGLAFLALPGTFLGVWNLFSISAHRVSTAANVAWIQAHGQAQLFGWVGTFILGISLYILPKFLGRSLSRFGLGWTVWGLWTAGVGWRWWAGVGAEHWRVGLVASAILQLIAFVVAQYLLWFARGANGSGSERKSFPGDLASWLGLVGFGAFGVALVLNLLIAIRVALGSASPAYPLVPDRVFLVIALLGFAVPVAWGYSTRFVTIFLALEKPEQRAAKWLALGVAIIVAYALAQEFLIADSLAVLLTLAGVWVLRIFAPSAREPKRAGVYRHYDFFVRLAYAWLLVGAILELAADLFPGAAGLGGASRHAITVGFLATLIFSIGPRILPAFLNGRELWSPDWMAVSLWLLGLGCLLRVTSESVAYSAGGVAWRVLPVSATLELAAVFVFVANLAMTLSQPMPAWFSPAGVSADIPVYFYIGSFPKTRRLLIEGGLKTLARVRVADVPRSLRLSDAAAADGADLERLLATLRGFFARRQPRRLGRT